MSQLRPNRMNNIHFLGVLAISTVPFIMVIGNSMLIPIFPQMETHLGINNVQSSMLITIYSLTAAFIIPFAGYFSDKYSRLKVLIPCLYLYALGGLLAGVAAWFLVDHTAYWTILVGRAIQGIGAAGTAPMAMALAVDLYDGSMESKVLGLIEATNGIGKVLSPVLGTVIAFITWFAPFFAFVLLCLVTTWAVKKYIHEPETVNEKSPVPFKQYVANLLQAFKASGQWLYASYIVGISVLFVLFGLLFYLSDMLEWRYELTALMKGVVLSLPLLSLAISAYITGKRMTNNRPSLKKKINIGLLITTTSLLAILLLQHLFLLYFVLLLIGYGIGSILPCLNLLIAKGVAESKRGMITALYGGIRFIGIALGPPIFGWLMHVNEAVLFYSTSILLLALFFWFKQQNVAAT